MEILIVLIVVGLVAVGAMVVIGQKRPGNARAEDTPDRTPLTDTHTTPPAHPARPVPGSQPDRARKGKGDEPDRSEVARRRG